MFLSVFIIKIARETGKAQRQATAKLTDMLPDRLHRKNITTNTIIISAVDLLTFLFIKMTSFFTHIKNKYLLKYVYICLHTYIVI